MAGEINASQFFLEIWILSFNPAWCNFIHDPNTEMEFYPLIQAKIEFHPFIQKERYPLNILEIPAMFRFPETHPPQNLNISDQNYMYTGARNCSDSKNMYVSWRLPNICISNAPSFNILRINFYSQFFLKSRVLGVMECETNRPWKLHFYLSMY